MREAGIFPWARQGSLLDAIFSIRYNWNLGNWDIRVGIRNDSQEFELSDMVWIVFSFNWREKIPRGLADYRYHIENWRFESISIPNGANLADATASMGKWTILANAAINAGVEVEFDPARHFPQRLIVTKNGLKLFGRRLKWGPGSGLPGLLWENDMPIRARS